MARTFKIKNKTTMFITNQNGIRIEYKGYPVGELPNSFGFKYKFNGYDEDGYEIIKEGKYEWFNFKGLTWIEPPVKWQLLI